MRASQVSSHFKQGDQSYLRLSLGQFFGQRSEALGCLGSADDVDLIKRVSETAFLVITKVKDVLSLRLLRVKYGGYEEFIHTSSHKKDVHLH